MVLSGVGRYLKEKPDVKIIGIEPFSSPLITEGKAGIAKYKELALISYPIF